MAANMVAMDTQNPIPPTIRKVVEVDGLNTR